MRCLICRTGSLTSTSNTTKGKRSTGNGNQSKSTQNSTIPVPDSGNFESIEDDSFGVKMFKLYQKLVQVLDPTRPNRLPDTDFLHPEFEYVCPICAKSVNGVWEYQQKLDEISSKMDLLIKKIKHAILVQSNKGLLDYRDFPSNFNSEEGRHQNHSLRQGLGDAGEDGITCKGEPITVYNDDDTFHNNQDEDMDFSTFPVIIPSPPITRKRKRHNESMQIVSQNVSVYLEDSFDTNQEEEGVGDALVSGNEDNDSEWEFSPEVSDEDSDFDLSESLSNKSIRQLETKSAIKTDYKTDNKVTYGLTQKGKPQLIYEDHLYVLDKKNPSTGHERWKCINFKNKNCKGALGLFANGKVKLGPTPHLPNEISSAEFQAKIVRQELKRLAVETADPPSQIWSTVTAEIPPEVLPYLPTIAAFTRNARKLRQKFNSQAVITDINIQNSIVGGQNSKAGVESESSNLEGGGECANSGVEGQRSNTESEDQSLNSCSKTEGQSNVPEVLSDNISTY